ncbi:MAG TPA: GMC family oxidoreductase N-terminal domain-containing protein [Dehalococcoidia bacterium]|nr:GMC family oxidoreductase N-terminal domain-containing protein [Dehalococcoidia bacterium]
MDYDLVVVGAGSAGSVIAARVTENPAIRVLLIEAGPDYATADQTPSDLLNGHNNSYTAHDWGFVYKPNSHSRTDIPLPRGKVVGGSSAVNTCIALRGDPADYAEWAAIAGPEWTWEKCLPAFKRLETDLDVRNEWHGDGGPIPIRRYPDSELVPFQKASMEAFAELGYPECPDHNDPATTGWGPHPMNKVDGRRISTALGYLPPARQRENLTIRPHTHVRRVVFRDGEVVGIEVMTEGAVETIECRQVVLSAGSIMTPPLLVRSGIGNRQTLDSLGLDTISNRPGVGARVFDHPGAIVGFTPRAEYVYEEPADVPLIQTTLRYTAAGSAEFNDMQLEPLSFLGFVPSALMMGLAAVVERPVSCGRLLTTSADPLAWPAIESNFLAEQWDVERMREGIHVALRALETEPLAAIVEEVRWPSPAAQANDEALASWCRRASGSGYHPCGTAPMGEETDELAVCDQYGKVFGVGGLRIADASIMPNVPRANTNLPSIMIGERFGEWLREEVA